MESQRQMVERLNGVEALEAVRTVLAQYLGLMAAGHFKEQAAVVVVPRKTPPTMKSLVAQVASVVGGE
jgi:hypothetical protein